MGGGQAAELLVELPEPAGFEDFASEDDEEEDEAAEEDSDDEVDDLESEDDDDFASPFAADFDAGALLDEEPRLSLR